jgi:ribonuclease Z
MEIVFLGTASMVPTKERNPSALLISYGSEGILIDCGEGTQRQMKITGIKLTRITKILISHWHGDHVLGLPGLLQSLGASDYNKTLKIYGPKGTKKYFKLLTEVFVLDRDIKLEINEVNKGKFFENDDFLLEALPLEHGIPTIGFNFVEKDKRKIDMKKVKKLGLPEGPLLGKLQDGKSINFEGKKIKPEQVTYLEKGKKITVITDTLLCNNCYKLAKDADLLVCEATYSSKLEGKGEEYNHMTAKQAAQIANKADVKKLILTHFSARYKNTQEIEEDARGIFDNVVCAKDFMKVNL